jgi:hypothetical protein
MATDAKRRLICLLAAALFAISSVGHAYAATAALMEMPAATMAPNHGMDCGGSDKASHATCVALCATAVAILAEPVGITLAILQQSLDAAPQLPLAGRELLPEPGPPRR